MAIQKHLTGVGDSAIYGETANINYFLKTALEPAAVDSVTNITYSVSAHSRRRYVGDSDPVSVSAQSRTVVVDPGRTNGPATPGKEMILTDGIEKRSFTYTGAWTDIHAFLTGNAKMDLKAYSKSAGYTFKAVSEGVAATRKK